MRTDTQFSNQNEVSEASANRVRQIRAIMAETERWLKLEWVQKKLEKRLTARKIFRNKDKTFIAQLLLIMSQETFSLYLR